MSSKSINIPAPDLRRSQAPFLVWPVSRREFYMSIGFAVLPALAWGMILFGWKIAAVLFTTLAATTAVHWALKRFTQRGKQTLFAHSILASMIMVALCQPYWPGWVPVIAGALIPATLWLLGGPGRERTHIAILAVAVMQFLVMPWLMGSTEWSEAILAKDRLFMGDLRYQKESTSGGWPPSVAISGYDAIRMDNPARTAIDTWDKLSELLRHKNLTGDGGKSLGQSQWNDSQKIFDDALGKNLPSVEMLVTGAVPARVATGSFPAMLLGGLYLAYRYILRPRSVALFLLTFILTLALLAIWPTALHNTGLRGALKMWSTFPAEMATLLSYAFFNSDALFAAIFILALPGTEPLTGRGRRIFLVTAGLLAALLARLNFNLPAATFTLCALMPLANQFDALFAKRSWMNRFPI